MALGDRVLADWLPFAGDDEKWALIEFLPQLVDDSWVGKYRVDVAFIDPPETRAIFVTDELIVAVRYPIEYGAWFDILYIGQPEPPFSM